MGGGGGGGQNSRSVYGFRFFEKYWKKKVSLTAALYKFGGYMFGIILKEKDPFYSRINMVH